MSAAPASVSPLAQDGGAAPIEPDFTAFARRYDHGVAQVAWTRLVADLETPVSVMLKLAHERPNSFLLESVEGGEHLCRYSFVGCNPRAVINQTGNRVEVTRERAIELLNAGAHSLAVPDGQN